MENKLAKQNSGLIQSRVLNVASLKKISQQNYSDISAHIKKMLVFIGAGQTNIPINTKEVKQYDYLVSAYKNVLANYTIEEIEYAFELGVKGLINFDYKLYDKPYSVAYVGDLMQKYRDWRKNQADYQKSKNIMLPEKSAEAIYQEMKQAVISAFEKYKEGDDEEVRFYIYDWLNKQGLFNPANEYKKISMVKAKEEIDLRKNEKKILFGNARNIDVDDMFCRESRAINRAKEIVLCEYFDDIIEMKKGIEVIFND